MREEEYVVQFNNGDVVRIWALNGRAAQFLAQTQQYKAARDYEIKFWELASDHDGQNND